MESLSAFCPEPLDIFYSNLGSRLTSRRAMEVFPGVHVRRPRQGIHVLGSIIATKKYLFDRLMYPECI